MIEIAVIDDDQETVKAVAGDIQESLSERSDIRISCFTDGESFLGQIEDGYRVDIVFADIEMSPVNGIEIGRKLLRADPDDDRNFYLPGEGLLQGYDPDPEREEPEIYSIRAGGPDLQRTAEYGGGSEGTGQQGVCPGQTWTCCQYQAHCTV